MSIEKEDLINQRNKILHSSWRPFIYRKRLKQINAKINKIELDEYMNSLERKKNKEFFNEIYLDKFINLYNEKNNLINSMI